MMILAASRGALRDELLMSHDAFALSPGATTSPQPSNADYQALIGLLSATARGRWFLSEFAKRNRNAETAKMLDAVGRIENAVAARPPLAAGSADIEIARTWALAARAEALGHAKPPDREATLAAAQRGARIVREIAYSMRACGNDPRVCNILDTQLDAIEAAQQVADDPVMGMSAAFDRLIAQLDELAPPQPSRPTEPLLEDAAAAEVFRIVEPPDQRDAEARLAAVADLAVACATGDSTLELTPLENAEDDALLEKIAFEMAMPTLAEDTQAENSEQTSDPVSAVDSPPSLGAMLLAQGLVGAPAKIRAQPFAALRRLTQAETVAFFT